MKTSISLSVVAIGGWLAFTGLAHAQQSGPDLQAYQQQELLARGWVDSALNALRNAETAKASNVGDLRQALAQAEAAYRRAVTARVLVQSAAAGGKPDFTAMQADVATRQAQTRASVTKDLNSRLQKASSSEKPGLRAGAESMLRALHLEAEIVNEAARRANPKANPTTSRMNDLLHRIATTDTNELRETRSAQEHETEMWLRERQRQLDLEEYQRLARNAQFVGSNGQPITGAQRERIALNAEKQLSESLAYHAREKTTFWDWWNNTTDSRRSLAGQIKADIDASPEYQALNYLSPGDDSTKMQFNALALAVRNSQSKMDEWYTRDYLGQKSESGEDRASAWWKTGFGTLARANDVIGSDKNADVVKKMEAMRRDTDAAEAAFKAAARTADPSQLRRDQRELLQRYGYIEEGPNQSLKYAIPQGRRQLGAMTQADLPGASVLDAINMETVAVTAASVALPELAAARASALAARLGASANVAMRAGQATSLVVGLGADAASQYLTTGKVDLKALAVDNLVVGSMAGKAAEMVSSGTSRLAGMLRKEGKGGALAKSVEKGVAELLGLSTESALQAAYQNTVSSGHPDLSYEDFLANMMTGALGRGFANGFPGYDAAVSRLPDGPLKDRMSRDPDLKIEERNRAQALAKENAGVLERFNKITENGTNVDAAAIGEAMRRGDFSWNDLKALAALKPDDAGIRKAHESINDARVKIYESVGKEAMAMAHQELNTEYHTKLGELERRGLPADRLTQEKNSLAEWWRDEGRRIDEGELNSGSIGLTSDIDRSWVSTRVRDAAKRIEDSKTFRGEGDIPGPTSARAWDLNEYYNVMPFIGKTYDSQAPKLGSLPGEAGMTHAETMNAGGFASAMMHMTPEQRAIYERNIVNEASGPAERQKLQAQFQYAKDNLAREQKTIEERAARIAEDANKNVPDASKHVSADDPDIMLRARDQIYGERMKELVAMEQRIAGMDPKSREAQMLRAEAERKMSVAMREGIETYTQPAGLDLVVTEWQGKKIKDPKTGEMRKRTFQELLADPDFKLSGALGEKYTPEQIKGMYNDQVMFMMEHMNGYRAGHETPEAAARALGKYGERALLAMSIQDGIDPSKLPRDHPLAQLYDTTQKLMAVKDDPAKTREVLAELGNGDADRGLRMVMEQFDKLPGLKGLTKPGGDAFNPADMRMANQAARRRWEQERQKARLTGGPQAEMSLIENEEAKIDRQIEAVQKATDQQKDLDSRYLRADQREAKRVEDELAALKEQRDLLPGGPTSQTETAKQLNSEIEAREKRLDELKGKYAAAGSPKDQGPPDWGDLHAPPLDELQARKKELAAQREACGTGMLMAEEERQKAQVEEVLKRSGLKVDPATGELVPAGTTAPAAPGTPGAAEGPTNPASDSGETPLFGQDGTELPPVPETMRPTPENADPGGPRSASGGGMKLAISQTRFRIGQSINVRSETPTDEDWKMPHIAVFNEDGTRHTYFDLPKRGQGTKAFDGPITAGNYEIRAISTDEVVLIRLPFQVIAVPTPGALSVNVQEPLIGSKIQVRVKTPAGTWSRRPWIGMYVVGRESGRGPNRLASQHIKDLNSMAEFTLPTYSANIEFRLFDRDSEFYQLDALTLRCKAVSAPGSLQLSKKEFAIGESVPVSFDVPEQVYLELGNNAWIGLYDVGHYPEGRADVLVSPRVSSQHLTSRKGTLNFTLPPLAGSYEFRLVDRYGGTLLLDAVRLTAKAKIPAGALTLSSPQVNMGQKFTARLAVPKDVYLDRWAHVSFHRVDGGAASGELAPSLGKQYLPADQATRRNAALEFTAPDYPGKFEIRFYDRDHSGVLLASVPLEVVGKTAPGSLQISKESYSPGESLDVAVRLPPDIMLFNWAQVTLHSVPGLGRDFRSNEAPRVAHAYVEGKTRAAKLVLPTVPGRYELRLYDRDSTAFHLLDRKQITVAQPSAKGSLSLAASSVPAGGRIKVTCAVPQGVFLDGWPLVEIISPLRKALGGAWERETRVSSANFEGKKRGATLELALPSKPGQYEVRLFDRDGDGILLDTAPLTVTPAPPQ